MSSLEIAGFTIETSSLDRVLFPADGITKGDLIGYYHRIAEIMVPHIRNRPLSMRRYPDGIETEGFYQQEAPDYFPEWIGRVKVAKQGGEIVHAVCNNAASLVYLANQNTITPHVWLSRADKVYKPDQIIFDLDPSGAQFDAVRRAAKYVRHALEKQGLPSFIMTTGSSGVHVRVPIRRKYDFESVRDFARYLATTLAHQHPEELTTEQRKKKRHGRVYVDIMRNAYAQTAVAPYAVRAINGAPIATPIDWDELPGVTPRRYTVRNIFRRLGQKEDPWQSMLSQEADLPIDTNQEHV